MERKRGGMRAPCKESTCSILLTRTPIHLHGPLCMRRQVSHRKWEWRPSWYTGVFNSAQGTETIPDEPPRESSGKVRQEICFLSNGRHVFQCNLVEEVVSRQPGSEEMDDNEEYALFFEVIKKLGSPRKFSMPKMQKFSVIANSIDHIQ